MGTLRSLILHRRPALALLALACLAAACAPGDALEPSATRADSARPAAARPDPARTAPFLRAVGTAQDGGFPHVACTHDLCARARREPALGRRVASLAIVLPASGKVFLIDATPDLPEQVAALAEVRRPPADRVDRAPVDGIFLTHAHVGHYLGLAFLGYEAVHTRGLPVWATPRMAAYLRENGPWSQLVGLGNIELRELADGGQVALGNGVSVRAVRSPHRDEYADTLGFRISGPGATVLYVPDTDSWAAWSEHLDAALAGVDVAIVDGTFYSADDFPGRDVSEIGHPLVTDTLERLGPRVTRGELAVYLTHLNHSNRALDPDGPERRQIEASGFHVLAEGEEIDL